MVNFSSIFSQDKIVEHIVAGHQVSLSLYDGELIAWVADKESGQQIDRIVIHEINVMHDFTEHVSANFRRSKLEKEIEIHDGVSLTADKVNMLYCTSNLTTEAAELNQLAIRDAYFNKKVDKIKFIGECSDVTWYMAVIQKLSGFNLMQVIKANVIKLSIRYPNKSIKLSQKNEEVENAAIKAFLDKK